MTFDEAIAIIREHQTKLPVDVLAIAAAFGLRAYRARQWPGDVSGMIARDEVGGYKIYTNAAHNFRRRRFTIAHEISHWILHRDDIGDGIIDDALYRSSLNDKMEVQANKLAAEILMPWHLLEPEINGENDNIEKLAEMCNVSTSAMSIRLGVPFEIGSSPIDQSDM